MVRRTRPGISRWSGPSNHPGMTAMRPSGCGQPDRFWLALGPLAAQFGRDIDVQHLFQPGQDPRDQGRVGKAVIPADHDIDAVVRPNYAVAEDIGTGAERMKLAGSVSGDRGHGDVAEIIGVLTPEIGPD